MRATTTGLTTIGGVRFFVAQVLGPIGTLPTMASWRVRKLSADEITAQDHKRSKPYRLPLTPLSVTLMGKHKKRSKRNSAKLQAT
jgi:hypothetical protein